MSFCKACAALALLLFTTTPAPAVQEAASQKATFLGFRFIGNSEPMTPQESARLLKIEDSFISKLEGGRKYNFIRIKDDVRKRVVNGPTVGECGGCEIDYGKELGVPVVMWGTVQKVSNLILNLNIYMADVENSKMLFIKSVDMRGNTDETWEQALNYMVKRYIMKIPSSQKDK